MIVVSVAHWKDDDPSKSTEFGRIELKNIDQSVSEELGRCNTYAVRVIGGNEWPSIWSGRKRVHPTTDDLSFVIINFPAERFNVWGLLYKVMQQIKGDHIGTDNASSKEL